MWVRAAAVLLLVTAGASHAAEMLRYQVTEPDSPSSISRVIVTDDYMRMDDGGDVGDFILLDRKRNRVYSVVGDDRTIFEIPARPIATKPPMPLTVTTEISAADPAAPKVGGQTPRQRQMQVNGKACYNVVSVELLPDAVQALRQFQQILAGQRAQSLATLPADMQAPCDLAINVFHPDWALQFGLPIQEWSSLSARSKTLIDFRDDFKAKPELFVLPKGYEQFSSGE